MATYYDYQQAKIEGKSVEAYVNEQYFGLSTSGSLGVFSLFGSLISFAFVLSVGLVKIVFWLLVQLWDVLIWFRKLILPRPEDNDPGRNHRRM